jgi:hypothetical protein
MRGRVVLLVILAVATALAGVYLAGWSPSTPTTASEPPTPPGAKAAPAAKAAPKVSPPAATTPKAAPKPEPTPKLQPHTQPSADPVRFGAVGNAGWGSETEVSEDRRALGTVFSDFQVGLGNDDTPDSSRSTRLTIPLSDGAEGETLHIYASGYSLADEHAKGQLVLRAGGRTVVRSFPAGWDDEFVTTLKLPAVPGATYQLSAALEVEESSAGGAAYLNITSFDAEIR